MRASVRTRAALTLSAVLVVACSGGTATTSPSGAASALAPSASATGSSVADVLVGGDRPVAVHVPPGYDPGKPAPLLIVLHGYGTSGRQHDAYFKLGEEAAQRGYLYIYPDGSRDDDGNLFWNGTDACCDFGRSGVDDAGYLSSVITEIQTKFAVDPKRIDVIGHSNGGFMSYALACSHADQIAAMISLAGATYLDPTDCAPTATVAVVEIHGTADETVAYEGKTKIVSVGPTMAPYPGAEASVATWATYDGCSTSAVVDEHIDVDAGLPMAETSVTRWTGCRPGGAAELWTIPGGAHSPTISDAFAVAALDFFEAHSKP